MSPWSLAEKVGEALLKKHPHLGSEFPEGIDPVNTSFSGRIETYQGLTNQQIKVTIQIQVSGEQFVPGNITLDPASPWPSIRPGNPEYPEV